MKRYIYCLPVIAAALSAGRAESIAHAVAVENGVASFHVRTNIPAIEVSGRSAELQARVRLRHDETGLKVERIEAWVPAASLKTGMSVRDDHMRRKIFTNDRGEAPDLRFESGDIDCPGAAPGREVGCAITGTMTIRGVSHAFTIPMKLRQESSGTAFRAMGDGVVKLSDYGIEQPAQLGVKASNEVSIHLDLSGKESALMATAAGGR